MRFRFPLLPAEFEIPDAWWADAGMAAFRPGASSYRHGPEATLVPLREVEPPFRNPEVIRDWQGFGRVRMINVLSAMAAGVEMPPVPVVALPTADDDYPSAPFAYRVCDGFHRFYASVAAGFEMLPVVIR